MRDIALELILFYLCRVGVAQLKSSELGKKSLKSSLFVFK